MEYDITSLDEANEAAIEKGHYLIVGPRVGDPGRHEFYFVSEDGNNWMWGERISHSMIQQDTATVEEVRWAVREGIEREDKSVVAQNYENTPFSTTVPQTIDRSQTRRKGRC